MNIDKLTMKAQEAIQETQNNAIRLGNQQIDGEHLHLALLQQDGGLIPKLINNMGKDAAALTRSVEAELNKLPKVQGAGGSLYTTQRFNKLLMEAEKAAEQFKDEYISVEHLYLALLNERNTPSAQLFRQYGITKDGFLAALEKVRGNQTITSQDPEDNYEALTKYGIEAYMFGTSSTTHGNQGEFAANCALRFVKDQFAK